MTNINISFIIIITIIIIIIVKEDNMKRHSKQRDAVRNALRSVKSHPTATAVYDMVRAEFPNISLATVYRNLAEMHSDGEAIMLTTDSGSVHFDACTVPHSHLCCTACGAVSDMDIELPDLCTVAESNGYSVESYSLMYYGVCRDCQNSKCQ